MSIEILYLKLGFVHICNIGAYDHILFLITLCAIYKIREWKKVLALVTAFTLGHTITLFLLYEGLLMIPHQLSEIFISITIAIAAALNFFQFRQKGGNRFHLIKYSLTVLFGIIHGLGFSNYLLAFYDPSESMIEPLLFFNLGVEAGQLLIVLVIFGIAFLVVDRFRLPHRIWNLSISFLALAISLVFIVDRTIEFYMN